MPFSSLSFSSSTFRPIWQTLWLRASNVSNGTFQSVSVIIPSTYLCLHTICYSLGCFHSSNLVFSRPHRELFIPLSLVLFPCSSLVRREHAQNVIGFPLACVTSRLHPMGLSKLSLFSLCHWSNAYRSPTWPPLGNYQDSIYLFWTLISFFYS